MWFAGDCPLRTVPVRGGGAPGRDGRSWDDDAFAVAFPVALQAVFPLVATSFRGDVSTAGVAQRAGRTRGVAVSTHRITIALSSCARYLRDRLVIFRGRVNPLLGRTGWAKQPLKIWAVRALIHLTVPCPGVLVDSPSSSRHCGYSPLCQLRCSRFRRPGLGVHCAPGVGAGRQGVTAVTSIGSARPVRCGHCV